MPSYQQLLQDFRERLTHYDALPQLVVLGLLSGLATGLLMVLFRLAVEWPLTWWQGHADAFETLPPLQHFLFPVLGSLVLSIIFLIWPFARQGGMVHLLERLSYHQGQIAGRSLVMQFVTATTALVSGHSVGREGPAIFLGAACSSLLGQKLRLPNNSLRLLIGCGAAAAISAAFNTPLAGVIFSMEVILMEYTLIGFTPIIVAAVTADVLMQSFLSHEAAFSVPQFQISTLAEIPWIMLLGVAVGACAGVFNLLLLRTLKLAGWPIALRFMLAGVCTGAVALIYPQIMGVGYDTISQTLWGQLELPLLAGLLLAKLLLTPVILGLGIPAGLIGPTLFIGALVGAIFGVSGDAISQTDVSHSGLYAMLGMGAMMAAVLNAPLAALAALLELTGNPNIILPGMVAIVVSNLTVRHVFKLPSIFQSSLQAQGLDYRQEPIAVALSRAATGSLMERRFIITDPWVSHETARQILADQPRWLLIKTEQSQERRVMLPKDLNAWLARDTTDTPLADPINLLEIPAERYDVVEISFRATLYEALQKMQDQHINVLCVFSNQGEPMGMLSRSQIEYYYTHKQTL